MTLVLNKLNLYYSGNIFVEHLWLAVENTDLKLRQKKSWRCEFESH